MNTPDSPAPFGYVDGDGVPAAGILTEAANIVEGSRQATHGPKERSFAVIAQIWMVYLSGRRGMTGCVITAADVSLMMSLLKIVRAIQGTPTRDHFVDLAGYGAIAGEISLHGDDAAAKKQEDVAHAILESNVSAGEGARIHALETENAKLRAVVTDCFKRLTLAADAFQEYAQHHHAKTPPDGAKAQRNADLSAMCRGRAVLGLPERQIDYIMDEAAIRRAFGQA